PGQRPGPDPDGIEKYGQARARATVEVRAPRGEREEMEMRIDQSGEHGGPLAVDAFRPPTGEPSEGGTRAHGEHPSAAHGDRLGEGARRVQGHDPRVLEEPRGTAQSDDGSGFASLTFIS